MCAVLGLEDGASVDPETVLAAAPPPDVTADDVYDFCSGKHEAAHACDDANVSSCASCSAACADAHPSASATCERATAAYCPSP